MRSTICVVHDHQLLQDLIVYKLIDFCVACISALITAFFPCVTFGQIAEIIDNGHSSKLSTHMKLDIYILINNSICVFRDYCKYCNDKCKWIMYSMHDPGSVVRCGVAVSRNSMLGFMFLSDKAEKSIPIDGESCTRLVYSLLLWALCSLSRIQRASSQRIWPLHRWLFFFSHFVIQNHYIQRGTL